MAVDRGRSFAFAAVGGLRLARESRHGRDAKNDMRANGGRQGRVEDALAATSLTIATIIPDGTDLQVIPLHSTEVHADPEVQCNYEMSSAILYGGTLTSDPATARALTLVMHLRSMTQLLVRCGEPRRRCAATFGAATMNLHDRARRRTHQDQRGSARGCEVLRERN